MREQVWERRTEFIAVVLISLATLGSAWCAYQSARWSGVQTIRFSEATAARVTSAREMNLSAQVAAIDVVMWMQYVQAISGNDDERARFILQRFRPEMKSAMDAWVATHPRINPDAPATPFELPEYRSAHLQEADRLLQLAEERTNQAKQANQQSDNYVLLTVIFAAVLFFAGVSTKLETPALRVAVLVMAAGTLLIAGTVLVSFPVY